MVLEGLFDGVRGPNFAFLALKTFANSGVCIDQQRSITLLLYCFSVCFVETDGSECSIFYQICYFKVRRDIFLNEKYERFLLDFIITVLT